MFIQSRSTRPAAWSPREAGTTPSGSGTSTREVEINKLEGHHDDVWFSVAFSSDGKMLASGSEDRTAKIVGPDCRNKSLNTLRGLSGTIYAVSFSPDGTTLATAGREGKVKLWDIAK